MVADIQVAWFSAERYHSAGLAGQAAKLARACRPVKRYAARALGSATRRAFLFHLAFYLVRHRGRLRRVISSRRDTTRPVSEIWRRLLGKGGMDVDEVAPGESCVIRLGSDCNEAPRRDRSGRPESGLPAHGPERRSDVVEMEPGSPTWHCGVWVSLYDVPDDRAELVRDGLTSLLDEVSAV
jgi:hypothetical protein